MPTLGASVIICVLDDWRLLRLIRSLELQTCPLDQFEVIVVTTGRESYDQLLTRSPLTITTIHSHVSRLSVQRNIGLAAARGEIYLTTDADCVADPGWLSAMILMFSKSDSNTAAVGGAIRKYSENTIIRRYGITIDDGQKSLNYLPALHLPYVTGANSAYRTELARGVGGYDEQFRCGDDVDMSYRLGLAGFKLDIAPDAVILHEDRQTIAQHFHRFEYYAVDQTLLVKKYRCEARVRTYFNPYPWRRMWAACHAVATGIAPALRGDVANFSYAIATFAEAAGVIVGDIKGSIRHRVFYV